MRHFLILVKKEIRELATRQVLLPIAAVILAFFIIGRVVSRHGRGASGETVRLLDLDRSPESARAVSGLRADKISLSVETSADRAEALAGGSGASSGLLVIPPGFGESVRSGRKADLEVYAVIRGFGVRSLAALGGLGKAVRSVNDGVGRSLLERTGTAGDAAYLRDPVAAQEFVAMGSAVEKVPISQVLRFVQSQTYIFPIVIFMVITFSAQMVAMSVVSEKENKTLEILLSSPVGRKTLVFAKLSASALVALGFTAAYMIGMKSFLLSVAGEAASPAATAAVQSSLAGLGLVLGPFQLLLISLSVLFGILCALSIALILGILSDDVKSAHAAVTPLMLVLMLSYLLPLFVDLGSGTAGTRALMLAIPFTHAFLAPQYMVLGRTSAVAAGILYQAAVFVVFVALAGRIFSGESVLTMKLSLLRGAFGKGRAAPPDPA